MRGSTFVAMGLVLTAASLASAEDWPQFRGTNLQWTAVMGSNPSMFKGDDLPVENVRWAEAMEFCTKLGAKEGKTYAFSLGTLNDGQYQFSVNDLLFFEDPHQLYSHWPPETWQAIDQHQIKPGMSELQATMSIGLGIPQSGGTFGNRTLNYPNGGHPLVVSYQNGMAVEITSSP